MGSRRSPRSMRGDTAFPGFAGLPLKPGGKYQKMMGFTSAGYSTTGGSDFFHFPDGNASIARALVRA